MDKETSLLFYCQFNEVSSGWSLICEFIFADEGSSSSVEKRAE